MYIFLFSLWKLKWLALFHFWFKTFKFFFGGSVPITNSHWKCPIKSDFFFEKRDTLSYYGRSILLFIWQVSSLHPLSCTLHCVTFSQDITLTNGITGWSSLNAPKIFVNISGCTYLRKLWNVNFFQWQWDILKYIFQSDQYCI